MGTVFKERRLRFLRKTSEYGGSCKSTAGDDSHYLLVDLLWTLRSWLYINYIARYIGYRSSLDVNRTRLMRGRGGASYFFKGAT